jgi:glycosyltransferase involved in cell wall biosynthesis
VSHIFVYRNCFTGDVSGGDMHTGGVSEWIHTNHPEHPLYLVHAADDGQEQAYKETASLQQITYPNTSMKRPALMFPARAMKGARVPLPWHANSNIFIAGSHFLPDVWPILGQSRHAPGAKRIVYIHHIVQDMPRASGINTFLANSQEQFCFNLIKHDFDAIITVNQQVIEGLQRRGFKQPILLSSNFVNSHKTRPRAFASKDITLAFCGRLVPQKGIDDFLHACEVAQARIPEFKAVMIGAGPEEDRLRKTIAARQLYVEVTGFVPEGRKFDLLARSKLFVLPSIEEGWGIVIAESLSVGTPVVAYNLPVYQEPFGKHIHTVPLGRPKLLARKTADLLTSYELDSDSYDAEQKKLTEHAKTFSRNKVAEREFAFIMEQVNE